MLTLWPDNQITRRKAHHLVVDDMNIIKFAATKLIDLLIWMAVNELPKLRVTIKGKKYLLDLEEVQPEKVIDNE